MKERLYFTFSKLLIRVEYSEETNTIKYSSHREITADERNIVESYLLGNFAAKTDYFKRYPSFFVYMGKDSKLQRELNLLRFKKMLKLMAVREKKVKKEVDELINSSMSKYYFDRIGDTILEMRKQMRSVKKDRVDLVTIEKTKNDIKELIEAYNVYSDKKISIEKAVPADLIEYFEYN